VSAAHEPQPITEADVAAFCRRLAAWAQELPANEAAVLAALLQRLAASEGGDTAGLAYFPPGSTQLSLSLRLAPKHTSTNWQFSSWPTKWELGQFDASKSEIDPSKLP
jgi:hypothetical protein